MAAMLPLCRWKGVVREALAINCRSTKPLRALESTWRTHIVIFKAAVDELTVQEATVGEVRPTEYAVGELGINEEAAIEQAPVPVQATHFAREKYRINLLAIERKVLERAIPEYATF
jgi:hypothetical protein